MFFTGVVILQTNQSYGIGSNNSRLFQFHSLDGTTSGLVFTRLHLKHNRNQFITVNEIKNFRDSRVRFTLYTHHGSVDDPTAYISAILTKYNLTKKSIKPFHMKLENTTHWEHLFPVNDNVTALSIDPDGCKDIDDAISFDNTAVGVHITYIGHQLTKYINKMRNYTSIYFETQKTVHMLPDDYSQNIFSLKQNKYRNVISMYISKEKVVWKLEKIKIKRNFSYDKFNISDKMMKVANEIIKRYKPEWTFNNSKEMIESFALLYNKNAANLLIKNGLIPIIREQEKPKDNKMKPALYTLFHPTANHYSLNEKYYGHFTSPIRRMVDIYNQHILVSHLTKNEISGPDKTLLPRMKELNQIITNTKRAMSDEFMRIQYYKKIDTDAPLECEIVNIGLKSMFVFIPKWNKYVYISYVPYFLINNWSYSVHMKKMRLCVIYRNIRNKVIEKIEKDKLKLRIIRESDPYPRIILVPDFLLVETARTIVEVASPENKQGIDTFFADLHGSYNEPV
jgi:exoribonuclease R